MYADCVQGELNSNPFVMDSYMGGMRSNATHSHSHVGYGSSHCQTIDQLRFVSPQFAPSLCALNGAQAEQYRGVDSKNDLLRDPLGRTPEQLSMHLVMLKLNMFVDNCLCTCGDLTFGRSSRQPMRADSVAVFGVNSIISLFAHRPSHMCSLRPIQSHVGIFVWVCECLCLSDLAPQPTDRNIRLSILF